MEQTAPSEAEILDAFEKGEFQSIASKEELEKFRLAARATAIKGKQHEAPASAN